MYKTTEAFVERLGIPKDKYTVAFQSRLGRDAWLKPFTVEETARLASLRVSNGAVRSSPTRSRPKTSRGTRSPEPW